MASSAEIICKSLTPLALALTWMLESRGNCLCDRERGETVSRCRVQKMKVTHCLFVATMSFPSLRCGTLCSLQ